MKTRIVGAIASQHGITLYLENGGSMNLPDDSWKTKAIMDIVTEPLARHEVVEVDLDKYSAEKQIESKTDGVIRFIKRTMLQLEGMLAELEGSTSPQAVAAGTPAPIVDELVGIVKTPKGNVEIPNMQQMEKHIEAAAVGNAKGLQRFMERIAAIIGDRGHTVQELLDFMKRGDLPLADDGSIVAYKVLASSGDHFVDCHTKKVQQKLGSRVSMDAKLVDPSRRTECSTGLHIARRGYLRGFGGDIITLVKVAPEDVIAVPAGEPDKMRAAAYHIVAVLPKEVHDDLRANRPMTGNKLASQMLADVIAGNHVEILSEVVIGAAKGGDVTIKPTKAASQPAPKPFKNGSAKALDDAPADNTKVTPKDIRAAAKKAIETAATETKAERDARRKREKCAAEKQAKEKAANQVPATEARFHAFGNPKTTSDILKKIAKAPPIDPMRKIPGESKSQRDARIKREKYAAKKAAGN